MSTAALGAEMAGGIAQIALAHIRREYPHKLDHVLTEDADALPPRTLHAIFYGSFDWHSCVHSWWTLLTLRRLFPALAEAQTIAALADESFIAAKVGAELAYLDRPLSDSFERPYGWAWLLYLHVEASRHPDRRWSRELEPLARAIADRLRRYLRTLSYPVRSGTHSNTAFALVLAGEWARAFDPSLEQAMRSRALDWYGGDRDCQAWEPSGTDFLSPALTEALCMLTMHPDGFPAWFAAFLPKSEQGEPATLLNPAVVSDEHDYQIVHLHGLNLSRAWCWRSLSARLPPSLRPITERAADCHLDAALARMTADYAGEHWLASFVLLALLA